MSRAHPVPRRVAAILVLSRDSIALERYFFGNDRRTRWMSMSKLPSDGSPTSIPMIAWMDGLSDDLCSVRAS